MKIVKKTVHTFLVMTCCERLFAFQPMGKMSAQAFVYSPGGVVTCKRYKVQNFIYPK